MFDAALVILATLLVAGAGVVCYGVWLTEWHRRHGGEERNGNRR
jgi:hypothetical protein